jgi:hypothetical protein
VAVQNGRHVSYIYIGFDSPFGYVSSAACRSSLIVCFSVLIVRVLSSATSTNLCYQTTSQHCSICGGHLVGGPDGYLHMTGLRYLSLRNHCPSGCRQGQKIDVPDGLTCLRRIVSDSTSNIHFSNLRVVGGLCKVMFNSLRLPNLVISPFQARPLIGSSQINLSTHSTIELAAKL